MEVPIKMALSGLTNEDIRFGYGDFLTVLQSEIDDLKSFYNANNIEAADKVITQRKMWSTWVQDGLPIKGWNLKGDWVAKYNIMARKVANIIFSYANLEKAKNNKSKAIKDAIDLLETIGRTRSAR